jgi:hypothetical protein
MSSQPAVAPAPGTSRAGRDLPVTKRHVDLVDQHVQTDLAILIEHIAVLIFS